MNSNLEKLLIIDFGSQFTQLIGRKLRELNVFSEIIPYQNLSNKTLENYNPKAIILSGGPSSVLGKKFPLPPNMHDIDHRYDSAVRAKVLVQTLHEYQQYGDWPKEDSDSIKTSPYYIIHPTLKHLAILGNSVHSSLI